MNKKILATFVMALFFAGFAAAGDMVVSGLSYDPAPVQPGSPVTVWILVKNDSIYAAEDVVVRIETDFPLSLQPGETAVKKLGQLEKRENVTVEYKLLVDSKATDGSHNIDVFVGETVTTRKKSYFINVLSRTPKLEIVESSLNQLSPGAIEPVQFTVKNVGGSVARNIVLKVNPERTVTSTGVVVEREIVSLGAITSYVESLDQGEDANVTMTLAVNQSAALKNYSLPITIEYYDQNGTARTETAYVGMVVSAEADVDAVVNSVEPRAFPGGTSEVVVDLFNIGLADARYVVVELSGENASIAEPRQFIGTLEADDFDSFKTNVTFGPTTPLGDMALNLRIVYKDEQLQERVIAKALPVNVVTAGEATGGDAGILAGFLGLVSLAIWLVGLYTITRWAWPRVKAFRQRKQK